MSATLAPPGPAGPPEVLAAEELWRFSVDDYHRMLEVGILSWRAPVELLDGLLVQKAPVTPGHATAAGLTDDALRAVLPAGWHVRVAVPVTMRPQSEPEPDVTVTRGSPRDYGERHPAPAETALVVEVSHSTYARDRGEKWAIYARNGLAVYWIVNLPNRALEVYSLPVGGEYTRAATLTAADRAEVVLDGVAVGTVAVAELLP